MPCRLRFDAVGLDAGALDGRCSPAGEQCRPPHPLRRGIGDGLGDALVLVGHDRRRQPVVAAVEHDHVIGAEHRAHGRGVGEIGEHQGRVDVIGDALAQELLDPRHRTDADQDDLLAGRLDAVDEEIEEIEVREVVDVVDHHRDEIDRLRDEALCQKVRLEAELGGSPQHPLALVGRDRPRLGRQRPRHDGARHPCPLRHVGDGRRSAVSRSADHAAVSPGTHQIGLSAGGLALSPHHFL